MKCPECGEEMIFYNNPTYSPIFYRCPKCGEWQIKGGGENIERHSTYIEAKE